MALGIQDTIKVRERIRNLKIDSAVNDRKTYEIERFNYIIAAELSPSMGLGNKVIKDSKGRNAVGIGFDMDRPESLTEWQQAFAGYAMPNFNDVRSGKISLTDDQVRLLFNRSIGARELHLRNVYQSSWAALTPSERLAIEDLNYNGGDGLVGAKTNFRKNIDKYIATKAAGDLAAAQRYLDCSLWEVRVNSNKEKSKGLQNRRDSQAELLNTYARDLNTLPKPEYAGGPAISTVKIPTPVLRPETV
ncbi:MAG: hypothetical protein K0R98_658 [Rickettsiaceae bacterium]|jgi:hypothetical protein|nr:hypothetical protein [Rickettsiaceae bacterium]